MFHRSCAFLTFACAVSAVKGGANDIFATLKDVDYCVRSEARCSLIAALP